MRADTFGNSRSCVVLAEILSESDEKTRKKVSRKIIHFNTCLAEAKRLKIETKLKYMLRDSFIKLARTPINGIDEKINSFLQTVLIGKIKDLNWKI